MVQFDRWSADVHHRVKQWARKKCWPYEGPKLCMPRLEKAQKIADCLGVSMDSLMEG